MKKFNLVIAAVALFSVNAMAAGGSEYRLGANSNAGFTSKMSNGAGTSVINVTVEGAKLMGNFEFGLALDLTNTASKPSVNSDDLDIGLALVLGYYMDAANYTNSFFARGKIGFSDLTASKTSTTNPETNMLMWQIAAGKNIKLSDSVAWSPFVSFGSLATTPNATTTFTVTPVSLSIYL